MEYKDLANPIFRDMSHVMRWNIVYTTRKQSIAEHQYMTLMYAMAMADYIGVKISVEMIKLAAFHDINEIHTGDIPSPVKNRGVELTIDKYKQFYMKGITETEALIVKTADLLEAYAFMREEARFGNYRVYPIINQLEARIDYTVSNFNASLTQKVDEFVALIMHDVGTYAGRDQ